MYKLLSNETMLMTFDVKRIRRYQMGKTEIVKSEDRQDHGKQKRNKPQT